MLVFDLDPGEGIAWEFVIETALRLRRMLKEEGLEPWPKLTGGKGLHLMAPLDRAIDHDVARAYAKRIAQRLAATAPDRYTLSSVPGKRAAAGAAGIPGCGPGELARRPERDSSGRLHHGEAAAQIAPSAGCFPVDSM